MSYNHGYQQPSQPYRSGTSTMPPQRSYVNTFMTPPSVEQTYLDGNSYPTMPASGPVPPRSPAPMSNSVPPRSPRGSLERQPARTSPNYGHPPPRIASQSPTLLPPSGFTNPYDTLQRNPSSTPAMPHPNPHSRSSYEPQAGPSRAPAFFGPGDPLASRSNSPSVTQQSRPHPPQRLTSAPNSTVITRSRMASNNSQTSQSQGPAFSRTPSGSSYTDNPRSSSRPSPGPTSASQTARPSAQTAHHEFDDCEGCRAELEDAIQASLQSAKDEQDNRLRMDQEREHLDHLYAVTSIENETRKRQAEEEEQLLQQAIASSKREAELEAQRNKEHESLILEESRQHALRQQEQQAHEERQMLEAAKLESRAEDERRRQAISNIQNAEKRALEESLREQEQEWLRRESAEQSLLAFFQQRDAAGPSTSRLAPPFPPRPSSRPLPSLSEAAQSAQRPPLPSAPQDNEDDIEAEYWKFAGHDEAYRLALSMSQVNLAQAEPERAVAGPSRTNRPLPAPPGSTSSAATSLHSKSASEASLLHILPGDDSLFMDMPPPAYEESSTPPVTQSQQTSAPDQKQILQEPTGLVPIRPTPIVPQLVLSNDADVRRQSHTLSPIVEVNSAGSSVISHRPLSVSDGRKTPQLSGPGQPPSPFEGRQTPQLRVSSQPSSPSPAPKHDSDPPTPVSGKRMSSLTMNSRLSRPGSFDFVPPESPDLDSPSALRNDSSFLQVPERGSSSTFITPPSKRSSTSSLNSEPKGQAVIAGIDFGFVTLPFATKLDKTAWTSSSSSTPSSSTTAVGKASFPAVIRLSDPTSSNAAELVGDTDARSAPFFVIRAHSWKGLLRAIAWYGNSRIEADLKEIAEGVRCVLRAEIEFVTPARIDTGYGVGEYARYAQRSQAPAHVSLCISHYPVPSSSKSGQENRAQAYLNSDEYQLGKRESKRLDAWYAGRGSTRRLIQLSRPPPSLPMPLVQLAQHLHAAHTFSAACPSSGSTSRHSPRDLHHAIERHDQGFIKKQQAMMAASAMLNNGNAANNAGGSSNSLMPTKSRSGDDNDDVDDAEDDDMDYNDFARYENGLTGTGSFDAQDQELMGKRERLKAKVKRRLAKRNPDGRVVDEDLAAWITPFDMS